MDMPPTLCHLGLITARQRTGKPREAQEHLTAATTMSRDMGMMHD
jgi:hypothetical protein